MLFISGVFYDADRRARGTQGIAQVLPLKHLVDGLSGAMVHGEGVGHHLVAVLVLGGLGRGRAHARRARLLLGIRAAR